VATAAGRIAADREACMGSGMCANIASRYFDASEGTVAVLLEEVAAEDADDVVDAVDGCPAQALRFIHESS
jgi:ferredoxin